MGRLQETQESCPLLVLCCLFPVFLWRMGNKGSGLSGVAGETVRPLVRAGRRGKTNVKAPNVLLALPFIRSFVRSHSRRAIKITRFAGRNAGAGGRAESEFTVRTWLAGREGRKPFPLPERRANGGRGVREGCRVLLIENLTFLLVRSEMQWDEEGARQRNESRA